MFPGSPANDRFNIPTDYDVFVDFSRHDAIRLKPIAYSGDDDMTIAVGGGGEQTIESGTTSSAITLSNGATAVIKVTAPSQTVRSYTVNIVDYRTPVADTVIDADSNGLIEIGNIIDLNAIRYSLDGRGYRASTATPVITRGCPGNVCRGYELTSDIDLSSVANWQPIGDSDNPYSGAFNGNGYTISNLRMMFGVQSCLHTANAGLFGETAATATIENVRLSDAVINNNGGGCKDQGALVGLNRGSISDSEASYVYISGGGGDEGSDNYISFYHGGLVGGNFGSISRSKASYVTITGDGYGYGGLVGDNLGSGSL